LSICDCPIRCFGMLTIVRFSITNVFPAQNEIRHYRNCGNGAISGRLVGIYKHIYMHILWDIAKVCFRTRCELNTIYI
jgi:hypothetical protein